MKRLGMVYGGSLPERRVLDDERFSPWLAQAIYLPELPEADLSGLDGLIVPEGTNHRMLQQVAPSLHAFLDAGRTVVAFGDQPVAWLPGIIWEFRPALSAPVLIAEGPDHRFHDQVPVLDAIWHHHGVLRPPAFADVILATQDGAAVLYLDRVSTPGTVLVSTLDPIRHCGETGLPLAGHFLELFFAWLVRELL
jgi:hypothetical protein